MSVWIGEPTSICYITFEFLVFKSLILNFTFNQLSYVFECLLRCRPGLGEQVPLAILHFIPPHKALWPHTQLQYYISQYCLRQNYTIFILNEKCEGFAINM